MTPPRPFPFIIAVLLDMFFEDPPNRYHPVAWMGSLISWWKDRAPSQGNLAQLMHGAWISLAGGSAVAALGQLLIYITQRLPRPLSWLMEALLIKSTFSLGGLDRAAGQVEQALHGDDLHEARKILRYHLVSRDTSQLDHSQVSAATIESVAENVSDGVLAPLFYYTVGGLPGALGYRYLNTVDSMLGYRDQAREWLGKIPARVDDLANLLPARFSGSCLVLAAKLYNGREKQAWHTMIHDARKTDSPNAGVPMSAMAGALDVELEKDDHYKLGEGHRPPRADDIHDARQLVKWASLIGNALFLSWIWLRSRNGD